MKATSRVQLLNHVKPGSYGAFHINLQCLRHESNKQDADVKLSSYNSYWSVKINLQCVRQESNKQDENIKPC